MGRPTGLEPATPGFTILCSNQLSYDRRKGRGKSRSRWWLSTLVCDPRREANMPTGLAGLCLGALGSQLLRDPSSRIALRRIPDPRIILLASRML